MEQEGTGFTVHEYELDGDISQPEPLQFLRTSIRFVAPDTAAKLGSVVDQVVQLAPPSVLERYSMLQVPVPPPLSVTPVNVNVWPAHTPATFGDLVAVGAEGSATTVTFLQLLAHADVPQSGVPPGETTTA